MGKVIISYMILSQTRIQGTAFTTYGLNQVFLMSLGTISVVQREVNTMTNVNRTISSTEAFFEKNQIEAPAKARMNVGDSAM